MNETCEEKKMDKPRRQAVNPYLPSWEYIPDGEPYVFGDRIYIYGSHDFYNGYVFCMGDMSAGPRLWMIRETGGMKG